MLDLKNFLEERDKKWKEEQERIWGEVKEGLGECKKEIKKLKVEREQEKKRERNWRKRYKN